MKTYIVELVPEWCDGVLSVEFDARSEKEVFNKIDAFLKKGIKQFDITAVDEWEQCDEDERHIACYSYPNCDEAPAGCLVINGSDAEPYGHRD